MDVDGSDGCNCTRNESGGSLLESVDHCWKNVVLDTWYKTVPVSNAVPTEYERSLDAEKEKISAIHKTERLNSFPKNVTPLNPRIKNKKSGRVYNLCTQ